jgi:putative ABC transport system permease protein
MVPQAAWLSINETIPTVLDDTATAEDTNLYMLKNSVIQQKNNPLNEQLISTIRSMDGVENVTTVSGFSSFIQTSTGSGGSMSNNSVNYTLTKDQFDMIKAAIIIGKADWQIFSKDNGVLIADTLINTPFNPLHYSVGDKIKTTMLAKDEKVIEIERPVMGVFSADKLMQMKVLPNSPQFLMARDAAQNIMGLRNDTVNLEVKVDSSKEKEVQSNLQNLVSLNRNIRLQSLSDTAKEQQAKYDSAVKLLTSLAVILFIFSLINFINTSFTNIRTRRREFGLLQSVGMTQQQIRKMLQTENSFYVIASTISAVVGVVIGAAFCKYLDASQHCILYQLPIRILMLFVACLIILHILMGFFASLNLKRESIIDRISISE